jgi:hypothetical protein
MIQVWRFGRGVSVNVKRLDWRRFLPPKEDKRKWRTFWIVAIGLKVLVKVVVIVSALWLGQSMHDNPAGFQLFGLPPYSILQAGSQSRAESGRALTTVPAVLSTD